MNRIVIEGGRLLDLQTGEAPLCEIVVEGSTIVAVEPSGTAVADAERLSAVDCLLIPGLVNSHTHSHGALGRGLVTDKASLEMFLATSGPISRSRSLEDKYLSASLSAVEMIRRGCTACFDLFVEFPGPTVEGVHAVAQAYADVGMRAVVAPMMADKTLYEALPGLWDSLPEAIRNSVGPALAQDCAPMIQTCKDIVRDWPYSSVRFGIGPTIPLHCSDDFLVRCARFSDQYGVPIQTHLAETKAQAVLAYTKYGCSLTEHLKKLGFLTNRLSAAHAVWIDDKDIQTLAAFGVAVAHNPSSNLRLGSGVAPLLKMLSAGLRVGIGTDASNTSDGQNMFEAARLAAYLTRIDSLSPDDWVSAPDALRLATEGSSAVLGNAQGGRIAPGYDADIVFLSLAAPHFVPLRAPAVQTAYGESGDSVAKVMIAGRLVYDEGRMLTVDESALRRRAEAATARLDQINHDALISARTASRFVGAFCGSLGCADHTPNRKFAAF